jgi:glycine reductase complex component B subunit gamma
MADRPLRLAHYLNQFFGGIGGEEHADAGVSVRDGPVGPGILLQRLLGDRATIVGTVVCGDNFFNTHLDAARAAVVDAVRSLGADVLVAGPAFKAGRYGVACAEACLAVEEALDVPAVASMYADNPAVSIYRRRLYLVPSGEHAASMAAALPPLANLAVKRGRRMELGSAREEGYLGRGIRRPVFVAQTGAERALAMLQAKLRGEPFVSEIPLVDYEAVPPAPPLADLRTARLAMITTSGLVPMGNPDRLRRSYSSEWRRYPTAGKTRLEPGEYEVVHGGYEAQYANANPNYVLPIDALTELQREGAYGSLYPNFFTTAGVGTPTDVGERFGREIAAELQEADVDGVVLVAT